MRVRRHLLASLVLLGGSLIMTACGSTTSAVPNGQVLHMVALKDAVFQPAVPAGYTLYTLTYESEGEPVQAFVGVPPGKGPFQLLVDLHGGSPVALNGPSRTGGVTAVAAANEVLPALIVFLPNYRGYRPSPGNVQDGYHDYLDARNGLKALQNIRSIHVAPHDTYLNGTSIGGFVALRLAASDPNVRAVVLTSPWPGMDAVLGWLKPQVGQNSQDESAYETIRSYGGANPGPWLRRNSVVFSKIHAPILIVGGTQDTTIPPALLRYLDQQLSATDPSVELTFVPGGHAPLGSQTVQDFNAFMNRQGLSTIVPEP